MYDEAKANRAVSFIQSLKHTKGEWSGKPFILLDWQEKIIRDVFGTVKKDGYRQFSQAYVELAKKQGKQLSINTKILTPNGFTTMGEIEVGYTVFDNLGNQCRVIAKSDIDYSEKAYKITFKDGEIIEAGENHRWYGEWHESNKLITGIVNTEWLYQRAMRETSIKHKSMDFRIPIAKPIMTNEAKLSVEPYLFGYWLGNGNANKPIITIKTEDVGYVLQQIGKHHEMTSVWNNVGDSMQVTIPDLKNVMIKSFHDKIIPISYLRASYEQRLRLLQGLMDSDGCISNRKGQAVYASTERALSESVSELLWSLGIKNAITTEFSTQRADRTMKSVECGRIATGETIYNVKYTAFDDTRISCLERKQSNAVSRDSNSRSHFRYIESIECIENRGMQCIQIDSPSHLYLVGKSCLPTHNSELAAAVALYLLCADGEDSAEIYGCASDRQQASIVFNVAADMVRLSPALLKRMRIQSTYKRMVYLPTSSTYQVLSSDAYTKHGFNVHGVIFDELHTQPDRRLFDVMTKGSGDARRQPLFFYITTAGSDINSICYEVHKKARAILDGKIVDPTFYPVIYGADVNDDWTDPKVWAKANPSLGHTITIDKVREACESAKQNPAEENTFRQLRLNQWVKQAIRWMPMEKWDNCKVNIEWKELEGRACYAGLDLSSTNDLTSLVLVFPPMYENEPYKVLPFFWIPDDSLERRVIKDHVPYDNWKREGHLFTTEGNVIHYEAIENFIGELSNKYNIREIAYDRWGATQVSQNLEKAGFVVVPFGQGFASMSPPCKELFTFVQQKKIVHDGNPVLRWNFDNVTIRTDPAGNIKPDKEKSTERIDGVVATIMALDRAIRCGNGDSLKSVYEDRGLLYI